MAIVMAACSSESSTTTDTAEAAPSTTTDATIITTTEAAPETTVSTEPFVEFDGESCTYSGPSEFEVGTLPRFEARNTASVDFSVVMLQIDAGLSYQEVVAKAGGSQYAQLVVCRLGLTAWCGSS